VVTAITIPRKSLSCRLINRSFRMTEGSNLIGGRWPVKKSNLTEQYATSNKLGSFCKILNRAGGSHLFLATCFTSRVTEIREDPDRK
jgi:hypothetical protein